MITLRSHFKGYIGFNIGLIFCGLGLLIAGYLLSISLVTAIGGTFFGASLASLFNRFANQDIIENFTLLSQPRLTSTEEKIKKFRKNWHMYHVNKLNNKYIWRHSPCDFTKVSISGYLSTNEKNKVDSEKEHFFNVEAGVRGNKLIMITTNESKDNLIRIFPSTNTESYEEFYYGFIFLTTLDGTHLIGATFIAEDPIFGETPIINDPNKIRDMDKFWYNGIKRINFDLIATSSKDVVMIPNPDTT